MYDLKHNNHDFIKLYEAKYAYNIYPISICKKCKIMCYINEYYLSENIYTYNSSLKEMTCEEIIIKKIIE